MPHPARIEGCAIVSADGMIADEAGLQPQSLMPEADQQLFHAELDKAAALAHGRNSSEGDTPAAATRRRLILTRRIAGLAPSPDHPRAVLWNPAGASLDDAWAALGLDGGLLMVIGGTEPFGLFLERGYDAFHLTEAPGVRLPGGRPVFPDVPGMPASQALARAGLRPGTPQILDPVQSLTRVTWRR
jgi:dihydrofolate reductase